MVLAAHYTAVGGLAVLLGSGPLMTGAALPGQLLGVAVIAAGLAMLTAAAGLWLRRPWGRIAGIAGGIACVAVGAAVLMLAAYEMVRDALLRMKDAARWSLSPCWSAFR